MPIILFLALGRVVNFINSELYGTIATVPWCVEFSNISCCRHPVQVYNALVNLIASLILIFVSIKKPKKGVLLFLGVFLISLFRFSIDFYREYNVYFLGLGIGQYLNIIFAIASLIGLIYIFKKESF